MATIFPSIVAYVNQSGASGLCDRSRPPEQGGTGHSCPEQLEEDVNRVLAKLGLANRTRAVVLADVVGLVRPGTGRPVSEP
jgi:hypothetical protein